jgi:DNA repair exonuclease SbcCD ATPase subunit
MKGRIRQRIFCDQHLEEEVKLVCKDCKALICFVCKAIKHENHATETVSDAAAEVKKNIQMKINQCSDKVRRIIDSEREADAHDKKNNDAERKEIKALEDQRLQLIKVIDQEVANMKKKIQNMYKDLRQQNAALKRDIKEELKKCSTATDDARQIIDQGTDIDVIKKGSDLEQLLSTAMAETAQIPMTRIEKYLFSPVEIKVRELISFIGMMRDSTEISVVSIIHLEEYAAAV